MNHEILGRTPEVVGWYLALHEESALLDDPEGYTAQLRVQAQALHDAGEVNVSELADMMESVGAAFESAVEEQLTRELNQL